MKKKSENTYREIYRQPASFEAVNQNLEEIKKTVGDIFGEKFDEVIFTGCGTSLYLAQSAAFVFSEYTDIPSAAVCCSELYYFPKTYIGDRKALVVPITRKSYTTEVRKAIDLVRGMKNVKTLAITCDPDSSAYNDAIVLSPETQEDSVIMTRSFSSMLYLSVIIASLAGGNKKELDCLPGYGEMAAAILKKTDALAKKIIEEHPDLNLYITLGQGVYYGVANECMNKMKEMGISNSEAYYSLEYRHGPMSLVDRHTLIIFLTQSKSEKNDIELLKQMKEYGAITAAIGGTASKNIADADYTLDLDPSRSEALNAPFSSFIGQMLGYYIAEKKQIDADAPQHLSQAIVISA